MSNTSQTSDQIRDDLVNALQLDLVGPTPEDAEHQEETIPQAPSLWYLSGFLVPYEASPADRCDEKVDDELDQLGQISPGDDEKAPESASARKVLFPSSMGISFLANKAETCLNVCVDWGDYTPIPRKEEDSIPETPLQISTSTSWKRVPKRSCTSIQLDLTKSRDSFELADGKGIKLELLIKEVGSNTKLPEETHAISLFLVNDRKPSNEGEKDINYIFQAKITVKTNTYFIQRPDLRDRNDDEDDSIADLQYRNDFEFAVGHNVSAIGVKDETGICKEISTTWIPTADVEKVIPSAIDGVELGMEKLAEAANGSEVQEKVGKIIYEYDEWIKAQTAKIASESKTRIKTANDLLNRATNVKNRIAEGIKALEQPDVFDAFCITNRAIARSIRQRRTHGSDLSPDEVAPPKWRPFQLAFLLMNIVGLENPTHEDRNLVDLLFFPTGGGKTEAYLGLAAFTMVLRRLRNPGVRSAGLSVIMRYTLRLLTLDQLGRAATLICALELERENNIQKLGEWPFEIGLWVGQTATPNRMGKKGDQDKNTARFRVNEFKSRTSSELPIPLESCPWCGEKFNQDSFHLLPNADNPIDLRILCTNRKKYKNDKPACVFRMDRPLPILTVDEPIYRRLPAFIIATVDKFANLPWVGETATLFGKVNYHDKEGFYIVGKSGARPLENHLLPPDLIIQDELHLISGPLGTMVGLYETVIDYLCSYEIDESRVSPKIVASTATVRRATEQIRSLFGRTKVEVFPPPGPDRLDSFFAKTVPTTEKHGRRYVGIAAQGRSLKVVLMRSYLALLGAAQKSWKEQGGDKNQNNPADPYMTLVGYFNCLRELGGSRRIVEDEVKSRLEFYSLRRRETEGEKEGLFYNRKIANVPLELTSRVSTSEIAETKSKLAESFNHKKHVDVLLATNMISVGLDITRLGLMVVLGQPKTVAEYIQATSRVGRDENRPGLVVVLLNIHRPRDRSHYERFQSWHNTFYRGVEATSVTPFSPRSLDRGLAGITVALARLGDGNMTAPKSAANIIDHKDKLDFVVNTISERAELQTLNRDSSEELRNKTRKLTIEILDTWLDIAKEKEILQYQREEGEAPPLLFDPLDPELDKQPKKARMFKAQRSLREVEQTVNLFVKSPIDTVEE
jgi:hypothetical protein